MVLKQNQPLQYDTHVLKGCPTFGESNNLRKLIKKSISLEELEALKDQNKKVILRYPILPTTKWNTSIPTIAITMIFVIGYGHHAIIPHS
jgi:hypothetical protein